MGKELRWIYTTGVRNNGVLFTTTHIGTHDEYREDTWNSDEILFVATLSVHGNSYESRKENLRDFVRGVQEHDEGGMTYSEYMELADFLDTNARKYGLTREFRANGILA